MRSRAALASTPPECHDDDYYLQLVDCIRQYKGLDQAPTPSRRRHVAVYGKVARDAHRVSFSSRTVGPLVRADTDWMTLYLNVDGDGENGWKGYDYAVNRRGIGPRTTTLEAAGDDADNVPSGEDVMDFYVQGDAPPDGRFTYRYTGR